MSRPQRAIILSELSEYRAPCTMIFEAALSMAWRSSDESSTATAPMFSSRRSGFRVPGMGTIHTFWASSKACAPGQAPRPTAVLASVVSGVMNATRTISVPAAATARERPGSGGSLRAQQRLDCAALVHRAVALRYLLQRQGQVEDLAGVDLPVPDQVDKLGQEAPRRGGTAVQVHMREEELLPRDLYVVEHADEPDMTACPRGADGLHHRLLRAKKRKLRGSFGLVAQLGSGGNGRMIPLVFGFFFVPLAPFNSQKRSDSGPSTAREGTGCQQY